MRSQCAPAEELPKDKASATMRHLTARSLVDRALPSGGKGQGFESLRAGQFFIVFPFHCANFVGAFFMPSPGPTTPRSHAAWQGLGQADGLGWRRCRQRLYKIQYLCRLADPVFSPLGVSLPSVTARCLPQAGCVAGQRHCRRDSRGRRRAGRRHHARPR